MDFMNYVFQFCGAYIDSRNKKIDIFYMYIIESSVFLIVTQLYYASIINNYWKILIERCQE